MTVKVYEFEICFCILGIKIQKTFKMSTKEPYIEVFSHEQLPREKRSENIYINKWLKNDGDYVNVNDDLLVLRIGEYTRMYGFLPSQPLKAPATGILEVRKKNEDLLKTDDILFKIHFNNSYSEKLEKIKEEKRIKEELEITKNTPLIINDEFNNQISIKWKIVGGELCSSVLTTSLDHKVDLFFTFQHFNNLNYLVFYTKPKQLVLNKGDIISFMFEDKTILNFELINSSHKTTQEIVFMKKDNYFENKIIINNDELRVFQSLNFSKWKIENNRNNSIFIGGKIYKDRFYKTKYTTHEHLQRLIKKLAIDFEEVLKKEAPDYFELQKLESLDNKIPEEECYLYLMVDLTNNFYKIGISNNPSYREFTLQSEKPTIELLASKKFINRKLAKAFETALHTLYAAKRLRGEWFNLDKDDISQIIFTLKN